MSLDFKAESKFQHRRFYKDNYLDLKLECLPVRLVRGRDRVLVVVELRSEYAQIKTESSSEQS
jgi:hypothetical protein